MASQDKIAKARAFVTKVENSMGRPLDSHIVDLFMDNADELGFSDNECFELGNIIRADKGLPSVKKWWS